MAEALGKGDAAFGATQAPLAYPPEIRRVIYTTNAIESLNSILRKVTQSRLIVSGR